VNSVNRKALSGMADEVLFEFLHSELVSYVLTNSEKDKKVLAKRASNLKILNTKFNMHLHCSLI
jgi:hypothetical protein